MAHTKPIPPVSSGQDCPRSGLWQAQDIPHPPLLVAKGHIMPGVSGRVVTWVFVTAQSGPPPGNI